MHFLLHYIHFTPQLLVTFHIKRKKHSGLAVFSRRVEEDGDG